ncbi:response regulator [Aliikangiella sp. G2MR2-5]|uniref:response regulator n=1 Tax=Aliikangiella sp. G2MR2-5 TaxID=2788943 RepID=UPI0018A93F90|nr:response regulator [Aliikangiella sp. G2MR2-5]
MAQLKIAVIDDATMIRDLVKKFIRQNFVDAKVFEADNGQNAMKLLKRQPVDLILCDWEMPEMNGEELLRWARTQEHLKNKPFIMVTSRGDKEYVQKAIAAQVSDYLVKPFNTKQFLEKIYKSFKRHGVNIARSAFINAPQYIQNTSQTSPKKPPTGMGGDSLAVLTAGRTTQAAPNSKKPQKPMAKGIALLRTPEGEVRCALKQLDLNHMVGVFKAEEHLPRLLDQVSMDLEFHHNNDKKVVRINGFILSMKALEPRPDCERLQVTVRFVDEDPQKRALISEYVGLFS